MHRPSYPSLSFRILTTWFAVAAFAGAAFAVAPGAHHAAVTTGGQNDVFLGGNFIEIGLNTAGTFGSVNAKPAGFTGTTARTNIGMNIDLDGFGVGTTQSFDYFLPGTPYVAWGIGYKIGSTAYTATNSNPPGENIPTTVADTSSGNTLSATATSTFTPSGATSSPLQIQQTVSFDVNDKFFRMNVTFTNQGSGPMNNVRYAWVVDPDNVKDVGGNYTTINTILNTFAAGDGKAVLNASTTTPIVTNFILYTTDSRARVSYTAYVAHNSQTVYQSGIYDTAQAKGSTATLDTRVAITVDVGTLAAGQSTTFTFYMSISNDAFAAFEATVAASSAPNINDATTTGTYGTSLSYPIQASFSPTSYSVTGTLPTGLSVDTASGIISGTPTQTGTFPVTIGATNANGSRTATLTLTISPKTVTATGLAADKVYDGTTTATISGTATLTGVLPADSSTVSITGTAAGTFATASVGTGKTVTVSGLSLTGSAVGNYILSSPTLTAGITAKALAVTGITANDKPYDGTTAATISGTAALSGVLPADSSNVSIAGTAAGAFATAAAGTGKTITITGLSLTGSAAGNYLLPSPTLIADISANALTITGITANNKPYDSATTATISGTATLTGVLPADTATVSLTGTATGTFATAVVSGGKPVTVTGLSLTGSAAGNYLLSLPTLTADITAKALTVTGIAASNKPYDGTIAATISGTATLTGVLPADTSNVSIAGTATGAFATAPVGTGKTVTLTGLSLAGSAAGNYLLSLPTLTANITAKALTVTGITASNKPYDSTIPATISGTATLTGLLPGDTANVSIAGTADGTFATAMVGGNKTVTVTGLSLTGSAAGNYLLSLPTLTADITANSLTVSGITANNKSYDGTASATISGTAMLTGVFPADSAAVSTTGTPTGTFATAVVGTSKTITITGLSLSGSAAGNYLLALPTLTADITSKALSVTGITANNKPFDGTVSATLNTTNAALSGVVSGDSVTLVTSGASASFADATVGSGKAVTISGLTISGTSAGNYTLIQPTATADIIQSTAAVTLGNLNHIYDGSPKSATATAVPSGLTINITYNGSATAPTAAGSYTVVATVSDSVYSGSASGTLVISTLNQSISFAPLPNKQTTDGPFTLSASTDSGLTITFSVVSGPAMLSGSTLTLTGASGWVVIRASQAGNGGTLPATDVTREFYVSAVGPQIYFGRSSSMTEDNIAATIAQDNSSGSIIGYLKNSGQGFVFNFTPTNAGSFEGTAQVYTGNSATATGGVRAESVKSPEGSISATTFTIRGTVLNGIINATIVEAGISFTATMQLQSGPTAALAGYYIAPSTNTVSGATYTIVGTDTRVYVLAVAPNLLAAGNGTITSSGALTVTTANSDVITGSIDPTTTVVTGSLQSSSSGTVTFGGTKNTTSRTDRLINLSSRAQVGLDERLLISGFVIGGATSKPVLVRAVGPSLISQGVANVLTDPELRIFHGATLIAQNDNWPDNPNPANITAAAARIGAFPLTSNSEAALLLTLEPGVYTALVTGHGSTGVALAEIYDASENPQADYQRLINISSRGYVSGGENILVGGFIVTGNSPKRVLVRGVGPALSAFGVVTPLADPQIQVYKNGVVIARNDNWDTPATVGTSQSAASASEISAANTLTGASAFPASGKDAALIITLAPGIYTASVSGAAGTSGIALIEIYEIPE